MKYLSIDIGFKNLGYALYNTERETEKDWDKEDNLEFGLFNIDAFVSKNKDLEIVVERCKVIRMFFERFKIYDYDGVIIERQVNNNVVAMNLMYAITNEALNYTDKVIIFAPLLKFNTFGIKYSTKKKEHKVLSVKIAYKLIYTHFKKVFEAYCSFKKKDDIADAINQLFTTLFQQNLSDIKLEVP